MEGTSGNKNQRILDIYSRLMGGGAVKKAEEAARYGVSQRSIQRDLDDIKEFIADQVVEKGAAGAVIYDYKARDYRLERPDQTEFSNPEILAVCKILLDSRALMKQEMIPILDKLIDRCASGENLKIMKELIANEKFHYIEPHHKTVFLDELWQIGQAIRERRVIEVSYTKLKNKECVKRKLRPLAILFSEYYFYLVAFIEDLGQEKKWENGRYPYPAIYRIDRIRKLCLTDSHFKIPYKDRFEEGEFRKRIQFMYGGRMRTVKFEYSGPSIEAVLDRLPTAKVISEQEGIYLVQAEVYGDGIDMWMKSQGDYLKVLEA